MKPRRNWKAKRHNPLLFHCQTSVRVGVMTRLFHLTALNKSLSQLNELGRYIVGNIGHAATAN